MSKKDNGYRRKTVDYYKLEQFINGEWKTILDTNDFGEYQAVYNNIMVRSSTKYRGKKYRRVIE